MRRRKKKDRKSFGWRLLGWLSHLACAAFIVIAFLTLVQCTIKKPEAPSWETNMAIPLADETWDMDELVDRIDEDNITIGDDGQPLFFYESEFDRVGIISDFAIDPVYQSVAESLEVISLDPISESSISVNLADYVPLVAGDLPAVSFDISEDIPAMGDFTTATIESGDMLLSIENQFGVDLDTVITVITDVINATTVMTVEFPGGVSAGDTRDTTISLAGKTISSQMTADIHCHNQAQTAFSTSGRYLSAATSIPTGMEVSSATASIPRQVFNFNETIAINSEHQVDSAAITAGELRLNVVNNTSVPDTILVEIAGLQQAGADFVINQAINPRDSVLIVRDLAGYNIIPGSGQQVALDVEAVINSSGYIVTVNADDNMRVDAAIDGISLGTVYGTIATTTATFDPINEQLDMPDGFDYIEMPAVELTLVYNNEVNIAGNLTVYLEGDNGKFDTIQESISAAATDSIVYNLSNFMYPMPGNITVTGSATFGGLGSINSSDSISGLIRIESPLQIAINAPDTIEIEPEGSEMDIDSSLVESLNLAQFHATLTNHLPVGVIITVLLGPDSAGLFTTDNPDVVELGPVSIAAGYVSDGLVDSARVSEADIIMDATDLQVLLNDSLWVGEILVLDQTTGAVRFTADDYFGINGYIDVTVDVSEDLWEDE